MTHKPGEKLLKQRDKRAGQAQWLIPILGMVCQAGQRSMLVVALRPLGEALRPQENELYMIRHDRYAFGWV
jgi:hypothetical protein